MPNLYCTLRDSDFTSYGTIQEVIAQCNYHTIKEKELPVQIIIHIGFFTAEDKEIFQQKIQAKLPGLEWREKL